MPFGHARMPAASFVLGSAVRQAAGIEFAGGEYSESFALADAEMDHWPLRWEEVQNFFSPAGIVVSGPLPEGRRRVLATVDGKPELTRDFVQDILDTRGPRGAVIRELHWTSHFHVQHRIAGHFRRGPVFIAADAAHAHSPAGGQGMNMGIQDAVDLGKVLALELRCPRPAARWPSAWPDSPDPRTCGRPGKPPAHLSGRGPSGKASREMACVTSCSPRACSLPARTSSCRSRAGSPGR